MKKFNEKKMSLLCEEEGTSDLLSFFEMKSLFDERKTKKNHKFEPKREDSPLNTAKLLKLPI